MNQLLLKWRELSHVRNKMNRNFGIMKECFSLKISNDPTLLLITSSNRKEEEEFVVINMLGENIFQESDNPSDESLLHILIYQQTNSSYIFQMKTVNNMIISEKFIKNKESYFTQDDFVLPILEDENEILHYISEFNAILIKNKGLVVWGDNIEKLIQSLRNIECLCEYKMKTMLLGTDRTVM